MNTNQLAQKKYIQNKVKKAFVQANVTIPKKVINQLATAYYKEFKELPKKVQEKILFSDELLLVLTQQHVNRIEQEFDI